MTQYKVMDSCNDSMMQGQHTPALSPHTSHIPQFFPNMTLQCDDAHKMFIKTECPI
jgi:hypothetical protein